MPGNNLQEICKDHETESQLVGTHKKKILKQEINWLNLPYEVWYTILVEYGLSAKDLVNLELTCRWFSWKCKLHVACNVLVCTEHAQ